jgi:hypothetical protein
MEKMRRIRIVSNGTNEGTKLYDAETGETIGGVTVVDFHAGFEDGQFISSARVEFYAPEVDISVNAEIIKSNN